MSRQRRNVGVTSAWREGVLFGTVLTFYYILTNLVQMSEAVGFVLTAGIFAAALILCGWAGLRVAQATQQLVSGIWAGLLVAFVGMLIMNIFAGVLSLTFFEYLRSFAAEDKGFVRSGMSDYGAFLVDDALGGLVYGTTYFTIIGGLFGIMGGWIGKNRPRRPLGSS